MTEPTDMADLAKKVDAKTWLGWALAVSLGINLFLGGFVMSRSLSDNRSEDLPQLVDVVMPRGIPQGLSVEVREELENQVRSRRRELRDVYKDYARTQREIGRLLAAEEFDTRALEQEYELLRELGVRMQGPIHQAVIDAARGMDLANRRMIIEWHSLDNAPVRFVTPDRLDGRRWKFQRDGEGFQFFMRSEESEKPEEPEEENDNDEKFR